MSGIPQSRIDELFEQIVSTIDPSFEGVASLGDHVAHLRKQGYTYQEILTMFDLKIMQDGSIVEIKNEDRS